VVQLVEVPSDRPGDEVAVADLRRIAWLFLLSAVCFFPMIFNPLIFGFFDASSDAERLEHVTEHLSGLRLLFTGIGLTELALGIALWSWGRKVGDQTSGRRGNLARVFAWVGLLAGAVALIGRCTAWFEDAASMASDDIGVLEILVGVVGGIGFSSTVIGFGWLMILGGMPSWLGVVWTACGLLFWVGILPLWFFVAALVFGIRGLLRFRPGVAGIDRLGPV